MPYRSDPSLVFDARMAYDVALTMVMAWLGIVLMLPGSTFDASPAWRIFSDIAQENVWAIVLLMTAVLGGVGIDTKHLWLKTASLFILATAHGGLAILFLLGNPRGGASGTYAIIALLGYYLVARLPGVWRV
jgi:hypothetical protein